MKGSIMQAIWKQLLEVTDRQEVTLPKGAKVLCVQTQKEVPCIWFITPTVDVSEKEHRTFSIYGTGHEHAIISGEYLGTFQLKGGILVFHVFEEK
jgi:hypothetical protein